MFTQHDIGIQIVSWKSPISTTVSCFLPALGKKKKKKATGRVILVFKGAVNGPSTSATSIVLESLEIEPFSSAWKENANSWVSYQCPLYRYIDLKMILNGRLDPILFVSWASQTEWKLSSEYAPTTSTCTAASIKLPAASPCPCVCLCGGTSVCVALW